MTKLLPRIVAAVALTSLFALNGYAGTSGINLSWQDCGTAGTADRASACASNSGTAGIMYASYVPPGGITAFEAIAGVMDLTSASGLIPSWWDMAGGGCRSGALSGSFNFLTSPGTCTDFWNGQGSGGLEYVSPFDSTNFTTSATALNVNHARVRAVFAVQEANAAPLDSTLEYYVFEAILTNTKTTGAGNCVGCSTPMCIVFNSLELDQTVGLPSFLLSGPPTGGRNQVTFQGGVGAACGSVPARNKTWGQIKSLYR